MASKKKHYKEGEPLNDCFLASRLNAQSVKRYNSNKEMIFSPSSTLYHGGFITLLSTVATEMVSL